MATERTQQPPCIPAKAGTQAFYERLGSTIKHLDPGSPRCSLGVRDERRTERIAGGSAKSATVKSRIVGRFTVNTVKYGGVDRNYGDAQNS
jgi:hypothetical protein